MYTDLPPHLQTLNAIPSSSSPPSTALTTEQEDAFWSFMNTDELFSNFGVAPSVFESKKQAAEASTAPASTPAAEDEKPAVKAPTAPTLESFLATFASEVNQQPTLPPNFLLNLPYTPAASTSSSATPANVKPAEVLPPATPAGDDEDEDEDSPRITGAKRLKQLGAPPAEIEEDKRRRNTEASARFRAKKKQREKALEDRAKELEKQVATLTSEKASLEKENNLLKFVLVNTQGATPGGDGLQAALAALGKRKREE